MEDRCRLDANTTPFFIMDLGNHGFWCPNGNGPGTILSQILRDNSNWTNTLAAKLEKFRCKSPFHHFGLVFSCFLVAMSWVSFLYHALHPWCFASNQAQSNGASGPWTEASEIVSQNKFFSFVSGILVKAMRSWLKHTKQNMKFSWPLTTLIVKKFSPILNWIF